LRRRVAGKREHKIAQHAAAMLRKTSEPSESDADIDGAKHGGAIYSKLARDCVVAGAALSVIVPPMQAKPH
jgi:hypothetical protein